VGLAVLLTAFALWRAGVFDGYWNDRNSGYADIGNWLAGQGAAGAVVMVGDAPSFTWHTGQLAIAVPNGPLDTVLAVADRYDARYLVLDSARPRTTDGLYMGTETHPRLAPRLATDQWQVYEVEP
jgi:hypothetical protein